jgi:hypothetical protein
MVEYLRDQAMRGQTPPVDVDHGTYG